MTYVVCSVTSITIIISHFDVRKDHDIQIAGNTLNPETNEDWFIHCDRVRGRKKRQGDKYQYTADQRTGK